MNIAKKFILTFTTEECNIIKEGLLELKGKICNPIIMNMDKQIYEQLNPKTQEVTNDTTTDKSNS